ncbi:MAG: Major Facilitator Superfamily protein [bacterium ADurb.Bin243]|nr:MAG: Major Facilitator Superfamily protein [bacterium ADurb.Bin243]
MRSIKRYLIKITSFSPNCRFFIFSNAMLSFGISSIEVFLGLYFLELKFREDFIGTYYAVSTGTSAVLLLLAGRLSDKIGRVASFYITLAGHFFGYSLLFMFQSKAAIFLCAFINGASAALRACTSAPFLHENARPPELDYVYSASSSYMLMGAMLGNVCGGYMPIALVKGSRLAGIETLSAGASYRYSILISMAFILLSALPLFYISGAAGAGSSRDKSPGGDSIRNKNFSGPPSGRLYNKFVIYTFFIGCGAGLIVPFFNIYFAQKFALDSGEIGVIFMLANIITAFSMLLTPAITIRYGKINSIVFMEIASLPFLLALGFSGSFNMCVISYLARNALMNMNNPVFTNFIMENTDAGQRGRVNSIVTLGDNFSRTVSTYISGRLMTNHGVGLPYVITAGFYLSAALFAYFSFAKIEAGSKKCRRDFS